MASIHSLPTELILCIYYFLDPGSHLDFAITSKQLARQSEDVLAHHRECRKVYDTSVIPSPERSTSLLWDKVVEDRVAAWHVRKLTIHDRDASLDWMDSQQRFEMGLDADRLLEPVIWRNLVQSLMEHASIATIGNVARELEQGSLCFKQALLITALCSRLRTLDLHFYKREEDVGEEPATSLGLIGAAINLLHSST
ncbi:hypothetical protein LTR37_007317 [Vermiconidia calcicola]|uniref:Uncharacterized protein n=1 Tax=Vermiconidia calcicola TaxID=1690605 RepID=A0ACC3NEY7_9PEZI|nr:hypothetical protein LTR37_007317 [Vermiconidia calcicola]